MDQVLGNIISICATFALSCLLLAVGVGTLMAIVLLARLAWRNR